MITKIKEILADQLDIELEDIKDNSDIQEDLEACLLYTSRCV